jgi:putative ABC transport system permease protein
VKLHVSLIRFIGLIVPRRVRSGWQQEWESELCHRETLLEEWDRLNWRSKLDLLNRSLGAFRDAVWLQQLRWEDEMIQDLRYGARMLVKNPGFTFVAILTLMLGIGANTAIFSVVNAVLLQPLPYLNAGELVTMYNTAGGETNWPFSPAQYLDAISRNTAFTDIAALSNKGWPANLTQSGDAERLQGYQVSANLFSTLGVVPVQGRAFVPEDDRPGSGNVVVLSYELWQRRFGGDPQIIGQPVILNGSPFTVVGVMPADFRYLTKTDLWAPLAFTAEDERDRAGYLEIIARQRPGVSLDTARAEMDRISREFFNKPDSPAHAYAAPAQELLTKRVRQPLLLLFVAVGFVLLIACANLANLLLARGSVRRRELAIRSALGAGRLRVVRQLLVESLLLAFAGGFCGLLLTNLVIKFLASGLPDYLINANSRVATLTIDASALWFTFALSILTSLLFGLAPALQLSRFNLNEALKDGGRSGGSRNRLRSTFVVAEVALAMVLLVGAGLIIKSFWRLTRVDLGFDPEGVVTARIDPSGDKYKEFSQVTGFYRDLLERVSAIPGVGNAAIINSLNASFGFSIDEHPPLPADEQLTGQINQISGDYFRVMGIPLRAGRFFNDRDAKGAQSVVIIDEALARRDFNGEDPIGKHITCQVNRGKPGVSYQIVGVVGGAKYFDRTREPFPHIYYSYLQENWWSMSLRVRARNGDPMNLVAPIRAELAQIDKNQPIHSFKSLDVALSGLLSEQRFTTQLLSSFGALSAVLAAIGVYGVMAYAVTQRTREIGVRMALGARAVDVLKVMLSQGLKLIAIGVVLGLVAAFALTRFMADLLFDVKPNDPATLVSIALLLIVVALAACLIPARRATRVDPIQVLRVE